MNLACLVNSVSVSVESKLSIDAVGLRKVKSGSSGLWYLKIVRSNSVLFLNICISEPTGGAMYEGLMRTNPLLWEVDFPQTVHLHNGWPVLKRLLVNPAPFVAWC